MSESNADAAAGVAGAEALLGLAAGGAPVRLPRLAPPPQRAGPEPPPLALPTQQEQQQQQVHHGLYPTRPSLSLPSHHPTSSASPTLAESQPQSSHPPPHPPHHYLAPHHLPPPPPPRELPHPPAPSYLPPPAAAPAVSSHPPRHDLPSMASLADWAPPPPQPSHYRSLPSPRPPFDSLHPPGAPRLASLSGSAAVLSQHLHPSPPWDPTAAHRTAPLPSPPAVPHDYPTAAAAAAAAAAAHHWPPPPQHAYPYHSPPPGYYYYPGAHATSRAVPQPHLPPPSQPSMQLPAYPIPSTLQQTTPVMSPIPPPLAIPLPVPRASASPPHSLRSEVPGLHDVHALRAPLPALDPSRFVLAKDTLLVAPQERAGIADVAVSKVPGIATAFGPALQANAERRAVVASTVLAPVSFGEAAKPCEEQQTKEAKDEAEKPRSKLRRGIADLMNPTDTLPGPLEPAQVSLKKVVINHHVPLEPIPTIATQSLAIPKPLELAKVKQMTVEASKPPSGVSVMEGKKEVDTAEKPIHSPREVKEEDTKEEEQKADDVVELKSEVECGTEEGAESEETRCPCGSTENQGFMIACDQCNTWQHAKCMGFGKSASVPDKYFCNICRPEEIRPTCIASRKPKEKLTIREKEVKESSREYDPLLTGVKPLELRKHFAADLKQKNTGHKLSRSDVFHRYAMLLRTQFGKYRQSVIEGIMVLLDMVRGDVVDRLDVITKKIRAGSGDKLNDDSQGRKRGTEGTIDAASSEANGVKPPGQGRSHPPKRLRPASMSVEAIDGNQSSRSDAQHSGDTTTDIDLVGSDPATNRAMSREERKLKQTMKLFARLEEQEREREKKKPRTGEAGGSPKTGHSSRPKTPRSSPQVPAVSPKDTGRQSRTDSEERKGIATPSVEPLDEKENDLSLRREKQRKDDIQQQQSQAQPQKDEQESQQLQSKQHSKSSRQGSAVPGPESEHVARDQSRRDREQRNRDKSDKISLRRKETHSPDTVSAGNGRRRGILEQERSEDRKRRRIGTVTREAERRYASEKEQTRRDASLDFKLYVPGRSVLGSRIIPKARLSQLERERLEAEESVESHAKKRRLPNKKQQVKTSLAERNRAREWEVQAPAKRRYRTAANKVARHDSSCGEEELISDSTGFNASEKKKLALGVSMVLVSERGNLPDKGQLFESSRLKLSDSEGNKSEIHEEKISTGQHLCLKKRAKMFVMVEASEKSEDVVTAETVRVAPLKIKIPPSSPPPRSPGSPSPRFWPRLARSPMLRSAPAPHVQGLRSVSSPTYAKGDHLSQSSPRLGGGSPGIRSSPSPSPLRRGMEQSATKKEQKKSPGVRSPRSASSRDKSREGDFTAGKGISSESLSGIVPLNSKHTSIPIDGFNTSHASSKTIPLEKKRSLPLANGLGLRSIRSVPVSEMAKEESPKASAVPRSQTQRDTPKEPRKTGCPVSSPRKEALSSEGVVDIFQQRLQGFWKPSVSSPENLPSGVALRSGMSASESPTASTGIRSNGMSSMHMDAANGILQGPLPSFKSNAMEKNNSWRTSFPNNRRQYSAYGNSKGSPSTGSPPLTGPRLSPVENGDRGRFRSGRVDLPGRVEDSGRKGTGSQPWNSYGHKNGWSGGNGRPHQSSTDNSAKPSRRGRH